MRMEGMILSQTGIAMGGNVSSVFDYEKGLQDML